MHILVRLGCCLLLAGGLHAAMTPERMLAVIDTQAQDLQIDGNTVEFTYQGIACLLVYDAGADRMRIVSPIAAVAEVDDAQLVMAMQANFHSALDARYALANGLVWSAFIHPLADLTDELLISALHQVATANRTFGTHYSSGALVFPGGPQAAAPEPAEPDVRL